MYQQADEALPQYTNKIPAPQRAIEYEMLINTKEMVPRGGIELRTQAVDLYKKINAF